MHDMRRADEESGQAPAGAFSIVVRLALIRLPQT